MKVDFIVVGLGIAGICLCEQLERRGISYIAIDNNKPGATAKSGGVLNPTVLKRFNAAWNASQFYPAALSLYEEITKRYKKEFIQNLSIYRMFKSVEEQNNWSVASDKREMAPFLSSDFVQNTNSNIQAPLGFGKVTGTAKINTGLLIHESRQYLKENKKLFIEDFEYDKLNIEENIVTYKNIKAIKIIFCEGMGAVDNPYFPKHAIIPNKGEYLIIEAPELNLDAFLKGSLYVIPLEKSLYKVGATFGNGDSSTNPTEKAKNEIEHKLKSMINCPFRVVDQTAGVRPTTRDRKPLLGQLPVNPNVVFFNGLGSRGFTMAPLLSEILYNHISTGAVIPLEMDINRIMAD